jgi:Cu-Zn family superoxide dismutase
MQKSLLVLTAAMVFVFAYSATALHHEEQAETQPATQPATHPHTHDHAQQMEAITHAVAVMVSTEGNTAHGTVRFHQTDEGVTVTADIAGLDAGTAHAIHVHQFGDITGSNGKSAGGHYNPMGHDHGLPDQAARHAGDLGNLVADEAGNAHYVITVDNLSIAGATSPIIGRGVIVHATVDDGGQPTGNAGARIAMGVVGIAKGE